MEVQLSQEVAQARAAGAPVVVLESSVIAQGLPHPMNLEAARACEEAVRRAGAVPAVVAVIDGVVDADDSKATNPHAAQASIAAYPRVIWVAGGLLKGASVDEM